MIKKDIIEEIVEETGLSRPVVKMVVEKFINQIRMSLLNKERIELRSLGVFKVKRTKAKKGRNLKTGEEVPVPEKWKVTFKPSKFFARLNQEKLEQSLPFDSSENK
ncbi:MAG: integration host factor subunit beta [Candidatus Omnitrophica bacterium]|nr:integration host factor subunit beta [Candidatus Omnitrophota bacterium]MCM8789034.1 integration host factor subunit beta [Candidatus Omnitrophota bacterium]